jgi:hypothetical protein
MLKCEWSNVCEQVRLTSIAQRDLVVFGKFAPELCFSVSKRAKREMEKRAEIKREMSARMTLAGVGLEQLH